MDDRNYYLLTHWPESGGLQAHRVEKKDNGALWTFGKLHVKDIPIPALAIGLKVVAACPDGCELGKVHNEYTSNDDDKKILRGSVYIPFKPVEPPEPVGVEYLRSLAWGTQRCNNLTGYGGVFTVMYDGLHWHHCGDIWKWDGTQTNQYQSTWHDVPWVLQASPETCPIWTPEQGEEKPE